MHIFLWAVDNSDDFTPFSDRPKWEKLQNELWLQSFLFFVIAWNNDEYWVVAKSYFEVIIATMFLHN